MAHIKIEKVSKYFDDIKGVDGADIAIEQGEFFTLLGPSGCGKTTLLRTLAGFYRQEEGHIFFGDQKIDDVPAYKRNIGMVFQSYAIFPHMTVFDNVAYGLKARKVSKKDIEKRVLEALEMVELTHLKDRQPAQLSGGQQQRIALARAVVIHPGLLLMDEPLSNLDAKLRLKMRSDIRQLQKSLNITTIYVTHDQEEALAVSDRIAVLNKGKIQQIGKPHEIYLAPKNKFVANFIGTTNFIEGDCSNYKEDGTATVQIAGISFEVSLNSSYSGKAIYSVRPEQLRFVDETSSEPKAVVAGKIIESTFLGEKVEYQVKLSNGQVVQVHEHNIQFKDLRTDGDQVKIDLNPEYAVMFDQQGEEVINSHANSKAKTSTKAV
ncbi:ABC transporter ATP-binding protein [Bacillus horti]|uniref:Spermidine/putrescine import ATP-binding protein PotA n=1 Tax=Caldalkalibacillus horti TaxID=77523 RepID=A0ABT9W555_9BACI|nr:ABC transporter ATP-binding protein [Bacillus horti]MDQ0168383.1 iron(III) transport system ATP-binding protein [Bacillus horti]